MSEQQAINLDNLIIRLAKSDDLNEIAQVAQVTWEATYSDTIDADNRRDFLDKSYKPENLASSIEADDHWFYVGELDKKVISFGHFLERYHPTRKQAELVRFYVLPTCQNMGIGRLILRKGFATLAEAGIEQCSVSVQATNTRARRLYERHGFVFDRSHGQFLGTQIITLAQYIRPITAADKDV